MDNDLLLKTLINSNSLSLKDQIIMILSNHIDFGSGSGALVSAKQFSSIAETIETLLKARHELGMNII